MATLFKADEAFTKYVQMIGFEHKHMDSEKQYFVNKRGNQIRVDVDGGEIAFINRYGNVVDKAHSFTSKQVDEFSKREDK